MSSSPFFLLSPWPQSTELPLLYELIGAVPKERRVTFCLLNSKLGVTRHEHKYDLGHQRPSWDLQALQRVLRRPAWPDSQALGYTDQAGAMGHDPVLSLAVAHQRCFVWKV